MARAIDRIWLRFAMSIAGAIILTLVVQFGTSLFYRYLERERFLASMPVAVREELIRLESFDAPNNPRIWEIYGLYWDGDLWGSDMTAILAGLLTCLPVGLATGFWASRVVTQPVAAIAQTAGRVALGDFSVRAGMGRERGELSSLLKDFNVMVDSLESLERDRQYTAAAISHELRTPLAVLQARLHGICDGVIPAGREEFARLLSQVQHLGFLVGDLHMLSVADAGRLTLQIRPVDLACLLRETAANYTNRLSAEGMVIELDVPATPVVVPADIHRLRQILDNLMENALRYASVGKWIGITLQQDGQTARFAVSDAGPGVRADMDVFIFQRFHREEAARHRAKGGTGLGLAVVHTLVKAHGGSIGVCRSERGGACFAIHLPLQQVAA
jgi:signal transduction histidine kinase